jgi:YD repeat-containing protein
MRYIKTFRANNISELDETEIRDKEYLHQHSEYDEAGHPVEEITYTPDGIVEHKYKYKYNSQGKLIDELLIESELLNTAAWSTILKDSLLKNIFITSTEQLTS